MPVAEALVDFWDGFERSRLHGPYIWLGQETLVFAAIRCQICEVSIMLMLQKYQGLWCLLFVPPLEFAFDLFLLSCYRRYNNKYGSITLSDLFDFMGMFRFQGLA